MFLPFLLSQGQGSTRSQVRLRQMLQKKRMYPYYMSLVTLFGPMCKGSAHHVIEESMSGVTRPMILQPISPHSLTSASVLQVTHPGSRGSN